ncbi:MAG: deoxyribodipyrimidine photo-lyase, partial [Pseudomonadales bacterium]|nr:deoxyribodipyrimidine photo-lyase [Pseudomonadales bacterium]
MVIQAMQKTGLYWLGNDLRRHDNHCLAQASKTVEHLLVVYCIEPQWFTAGRYQQVRMGQHRRQFLAQSLKQLKQQLESEGQQLLIFAGDPLTVLPKLIEQYKVEHVFRSLHPAFDEQQQWQWLLDNSDQLSSGQSLQWHEMDNLSLINQHDISKLTNIDIAHRQANLAPQEFIPSFSKFRRFVETAIKKQHFIIDEPLTDQYTLPKPVALSPSNYTQLAEHWVSDIDNALEL